jgi:hypothetical protein
MKRLTTLLMVLFVVLLQGQHLVKGYLVNQFGEALPNCKLSIADFLIETFSDERGFFSLEYPPNLSQGELLIETPEGETQL